MSRSRSYLPEPDGAGRKSDISFSVIVPTLNEEETINACVSSIRSAGSNIEVIVADGGSTDATVLVSEKLGVKVLKTERCRGKQCNSAAAMASGDIVVFLHADTLLPTAAFDELRAIFNQDNADIGTFGINFDTRHWFLRLLSFLARFDMGLFRFGDQGIVVRKALFQHLGGFPNWDLFEDLALTRKARKITKVRRFPMSVTTSARRFIQNGIFRQQLLNVYYTVQYLMGVSPRKLAEKYYGNRLKQTA